jgi:hypothetical protein
VKNTGTHSIERTHSERVETATRAIKTAWEDRGEERNLAADSLYDVAGLLADIRHYCQETGIDFYNADRIAYEHYLAEKE